MAISSKELINRFFKYVKISSESGNEKEVCDMLFYDLTALGLSPQKKYVESDYRTNGYNIYTYIEGNILGNPIILNGHLDTVSPGKNIFPVIKNGHIESNTETILGADDKTAIVTILSAVETIINDNLDHRSLELLFTVGEEAGLKGIKAFNTSILKSKVSFTFDSSNPVGGMIVSAPSNTNMEIDIIGKSAHAGRVPEQGISAIQVASKAIADMPLMRIDEETTCNIGTFKSVYATNIVPDNAKILMAARSLDNKKLQKQVEVVRNGFQQACDKTGAILKFVENQSYLAYQKNNNDKSVKMAKKAMENLNIKPFDVKACGGSDAHILNAKGFDAINLACGNKRVHSIDESVSIESLEKVYNLIIQLATQL